MGFLTKPESGELWRLSFSGVAWGLLLLAVAVFVIQLIRHPKWGLSFLSG